MRSSGGNNAARVLVLPTLHTSSEQARIDELLATFNALGDANLASTMHFYGYWPFSVNIDGSTRYDAETRNDLTASFDRMANSFVARNIPVIIGEHGLLGFDKHTGTVEQGEKLKFFEYLGYYARTKGLTTMWWDNGQHLDRTTLQWKDPELFAQLQSSWTTRSGTASADFVYNTRSSSITAKTITIKAVDRIRRRFGRSTSHTARAHFRGRRTAQLPGVPLPGAADRLERPDRHPPRVRARGDGLPSGTTR